MSHDVAIFNILQELPEGYLRVTYRGKKYGLTKAAFNDGKSIKIYARELGGKNFISLNYYMVSSNNLLKPCEMPKEKVIHFLLHMSLAPC